MWIRRSAIAAALIAACELCLGSPATAQKATFEGPPIDYLRRQVDDPVAKLNERLEAGQAELTFDPRHGYLPSVLEALNVPVSSQALVFSKTSLQLRRISPQMPRAIYFNDDVYVGWCLRGDVLELAATDARQGAIFYTLAQQPAEQPRFVRDQGSCLSCHATSRTQRVPGYLVRSVFADGLGHPLLGSGSFTTDHTSPFEERWGGWYVTGTHGQMRHLGNRVFSAEESEELDFDLESGANLQSLDALVNTAPYLTKHSDLVALMVLEHQTQTHNALAAANYETRLALHQSFQMNEALDRPEGHISDSANRRIDKVAERAVRYLLLCDELPLQSPVAGTSGFAEQFPQRHRRDVGGRSLRDLDLQQRLFRYPCSYLIHSEAFCGLPDEVRLRIVDRITGVLRGDESEGFEHLSSADRQAISEILAATHSDFASLAGQQ